MNAPHYASSPSDYPKPGVTGLEDIELGTHIHDDSPNEGQNTTERRNHMHDSKVSGGTDAPKSAFGAPKRVTEGKSMPGRVICTRMLSTMNGVVDSKVIATSRTSAGRMRSIGRSSSGGSSSTRKTIGRSTMPTGTSCPSSLRRP